MHKAIIILAAVVAVATATHPLEQIFAGSDDAHRQQPSMEPRSIRDQYFNTRQNHFRPQSPKVERWPYMYNDQFYTEGGPVFVYINGGDAVTYQVLQSGLMYDIAQEVNATIVSFEHRFFRRSIFAPDASFESLETLSIEQNLNDLANMLVQYKEYWGQNPRVILFGFGYGAQLAVYARMRFPHLVDGVWSSSGAFNFQRATPDYIEDLGETILEYSPACHDNLRDAFDQMTDMSDAGFGEVLADRLHNCDAVDTNSTEAVAYFYLREIFLIVTEINSNHMSGLANFCSYMTDGFNAITNFVRWKSSVWGLQNCFQFNYEWMLNYLRDDFWLAPALTNGHRQLVYMLCTQFGSFPATETANATLNPFGDIVYLNFGQEFCADVFGEDYSVDALWNFVDEHLIQYNGLNPEVTNVVFTTGELDPFRRTGMLEAPNSQAPVLTIENFGRSADFDSGLRDQPEVRAVIDTIRSYIYEWIGHGDRK